MRLYVAAGFGAAAALSVVLLAGCGSASQVPGVASAPGAAALPRDPISLLRAQASGELAGPIPRERLREQLEAIASKPRPRFASHSSAKIGMWLANTSYGYLLGATANAKAVVTSVNVESNGCYYPITVKVDHAGNVWTACEYDAAFTGGSVQEYTSAGVQAGAYDESAPQCSPSATCTFSGYGFDEANDATNVFDTLATFSLSVCTKKCTVTSGSGFEYWPAGSPSATPTLIALPYANPVKEVYYMDLDQAGNIWFDYYGCISATCGYGLAEITNPTTASWSFVPILPPGTIGFAGGIYVSGGGATLNVTDQLARTIAQYALPLSPSGTPLDTLGPTKQNLFGCGDPVSGGFNKAERMQADGDPCGWVDIGKVTANKWRAAGGINYSGIEGAAYTPSDR